MITQVIVFGFICYFFVFVYIRKFFGTDNINALIREARRIEREKINNTSIKIELHR